MNMVFHKSESRGRADHNWLISRHTFSFADYYNPQCMNFGLLRVLNDDIVQPSMGFGSHPHENMEIISIPLAGSLRHQDCMNNKHVIREGEVQVMSAGSGLTHSEYNDSDSEELKFLQIWIFPREKNIPPRYEQKHFDRETRQNKFQTLVAPDASDETIWINQDAWLSMADINVGNQITYPKHLSGNGVYFFVIKGTVEVDGYLMERRDGMGLVKGEGYKVSAVSEARVLAIEVPMKA
ncbi:MAG: pirin family protein [Deltaproteobacteria bacterium]|nr:pirin family protein [Deltaproteobacteria bacterium]